MTKGDANLYLHVIISGEAEVWVNGKKVATLLAPQEFGLLSLLNGVRCTATVRSGLNCPTICYLLDRLRGDGIRHSIESGGTLVPLDADPDTVDGMPTHEMFIDNLELRQGNPSKSSLDGSKARELDSFLLSLPSFLVLDCSEGGTRRLLGLLRV